MISLSSNPLSYFHKFYLLLGTYTKAGLLAGYSTRLIEKEREIEDIIYKRHHNLQTQEQEVVSED